MNDKTVTRGSDPAANEPARSIVSVATPAEVDYWCRRLGADLPTLQRAITAVGPSSADIQAWLMDIPPGHGEER